LPGPPDERNGPQAIEARLLLEKVCAIGESQLRSEEWRMIRQSIDCDRAGMAQEFKLKDANNMRVRLHRVRRKLAKLTGLDES
jgi:hypothetical protein